MKIQKKNWGGGSGGGQIAMLFEPMFAQDLFWAIVRSVSSLTVLVVVIDGNVILVMYVGFVPRVTTHGSTALH